MKSRESSFSTLLSEVDIAGSELVDELQVTVFGRDVDGGVAHLNNSV